MPDIPPRSTRAAEPVLAITDDPTLHAELNRLADAALTTVGFTTDLDQIRRGWPHARLVVIGRDQATAITAASLPRRAGVLVVSTNLDDPDVWRTTLAVGAEYAVFLPDAEAWLIDQLAACHYRHSMRTLRATSPFSPAIRTVARACHPT